MDRFDRTFNRTDPISGRPFCSGHPDGVLVICVIYSLLALAVVGAGVAAVMQSPGGVGSKLLTFALFLCGAGVYGLAVWQLLCRSVVALYCTALLAMVALLALFGVALSGEGPLPPVVAAVVLHGYAAFYLVSLRKDRLLA